MDLFNNPREPLIMDDDIIIDLENNNYFSEEAYIKMIYDEEYECNGTVSLISFQKHMIPFRINEEWLVWWLPVNHVLVKLIHVNPLKKVICRWGSLSVYSDEAINGALLQINELCEKYNLKLDESKHK